MAQWQETITHLECDWCGNPVTFTTGKKVENEDFSNESCVCIECREGVNTVRAHRCSMAEANRLKNRPISFVEQAKATQYASRQGEVTSVDWNRSSQEVAPSAEAGAEEKMRGAIDEIERLRKELAEAQERKE